MEILISCVLTLIGVVYGYYTVEGSGIAEHPYQDVYGGAPGAFAPSSMSGRDETISRRNWSGGTRSALRRPDSLSVAQRRRAWRVAAESVLAT